MDPVIALAFVAAAALTGALTPLMGRFAARVGLVSPARPDRWGSRPTPLLGGIALAAGVLVPTLLLARPPDLTFALLTTGVLAALVLGVVDDVRGLRPTSKLVGQVIIASGLAIAGVRVGILDFPPADFVLTVLWVSAMMNALNLVDNMDGLAAGLAAIAAVVLFLMAPPEATVPRLMAVALAGACVGFLIHNFPPARVYMGDAGSLTLGFLLAGLALVVTNEVASNVGLAVFGPLLALGLPLFDTALVTFVRRVEGRPVSQGGRDHTSHRLAALGLSERETVLVLYVVAAVLAGLGLVSTAIGLAVLPLVALAIVALVLFGAFLAAEAPTAASRSPSDVARSSVLGAGRTLVRFGGEIALDLVLATVALFSAYLIRYESIPIGTWMPLFVSAAPLVIPAQLIAFVLLDVYRTLWRYVGVTDVLAIVRATFVGTLVAAVVMLYPLNMFTQSRASLLIDWVLFSVLVVASRISLVTLRHSFALRPSAGDRRVLIVGATDLGEIAVRLMLHSRKVDYHPSGFLDDDRGKQRRRISGVPVLGRVEDLERIAERERVDLVVYAADDEAQCEEVRAICARLCLEFRELDRVL